MQPGAFIVNPIPVIQLSLRRLLPAATQIPKNEEVIFSYYNLYSGYIFFFCTDQK